MNKSIFLAAVLALFSLTGCNSTDRPQGKYTTVDGSEFVVGASYKYLGNGKFERQKVIDFKDLK